MMFKFLFIFLLLYAAFIIFSNKFSSPSRVIMIFGKRRCGKSSDIVRRSLIEKKKGHRVFCTDPTITTCEYVNPEDLGKMTFPPFSTLYLDEVGVLFHKRSYADKQKKAIMDDFRNLIKYCGHYPFSIVMYSQAYDIDLSLKEACDALYLYKKYFNILTIGKRINKSVVLTQDADGRGTMADSFSFDPFYVRGSRIYSFIPKYVKYYDSFSKLDLPDFDSYYKKEVPEPAHAIARRNWNIKFKNSIAFLHKKK